MTYSVDERITEALLAYDAAVASCPVEQGRVKRLELCPKCRATARETCGITAQAGHNFVTTVRGVVFPQVSA